MYAEVQRPAVPTETPRRAEDFVAPDIHRHPETPAAAVPEEDLALRGGAMRNVIEAAKRKGNGLAMPAPSPFPSPGGRGKIASRGGGEGAEGGGEMQRD